jgi:hypothetical protein
VKQITLMTCALIFVAFVCAFATTSDHAISLAGLAQSESTQCAALTDGALAPLNPLVALVKPQKNKPQKNKQVARIFEWVMQHGFVYSLLFFLKKVSWTHTLLGVFLVIVAVFFPSSVLPEASKGRVKLLGIDLSFQGTLRLAAIMAGIVLIGSGVYQRPQGATKELPPLPAEPSERP